VFVSDGRAVDILQSNTQPVIGERTVSVSSAETMTLISSPAISQKVYSWASQSLQLNNSQDSERRPLEPTLIFLFGAGIFGLASFSRRIFDK
jgi:hypothetical protein